METKTTPVHPLLVGTTPGPYTKGIAVSSVGGSLYPIDGPARIDGLYNKTRAKKLIHQLNAAHNAACPSLAAENALLAEQVERMRGALESVCDGVERASSDNVAGANMRITVPSLRAILTSLTPASK